MKSIEFVPDAFNEYRQWIETDILQTEYQLI